MTLIGVAEVEARGPYADTAHAARALEKAKEALVAIRKFVSKFPFSDAEVEYLRERSDQIEQAIRKIQGA